MNDIDARVRKVVAEQLGIELSLVTDESEFVADLGADSLDRVEIVIGLEEEFDIEIPDDEAEKIHTVGDATRYIKTYLDRNASLRKKG